MATIVYLVITIVLPLLFCIYAILKREVLPFILGAAAFSISQLLIRLPLLNFIARESSHFKFLQATEPILIFAALAFSAGIFEETARWLAMRYMLKERTIRKGIYFGLGHGGIEAMIIVGIPILLQLSLLQASSVLYLYLGAFERLCAMTIHVCLSIIVLCSVQQKKRLLLLLAIIIHGMINFIASFVSAVVNPLASEISLAILSVILVLYTINISRRFKNDEKKRDSYFT